MTTMLSRVMFCALAFAAALCAQQVQTTMFPMLAQNGPPSSACPGAGMLDFDLISHTLYGCSIAGGQWGSVTGMAGGNISYCPDISQYANAIVCANTGGTFTVFNPGVSVIVKVANSTTGPTIIYETGVGIKNVTKNGATALAANDMVAGGLYLLTYDSAEMVMTQNLGASSGGGTVTITDDIFLGTAVYNNGLGQEYTGSWDLDSTATAPTLVVTGATQQAGAFGISNSGTPTLYHRRVLPSTWTATGGIDLHLYWADECCGSGNVKWTAALGCAAAGSGAYELSGGGSAPVTYNGTSSVTSASGGAGIMPVKSDITGLELTNCAANSQLAVKLYRDNTVGSNVGGVIKLLYAVLTIRRTNQ